MDAHVTLCVLTKHCLICYGFPRPLPLSVFPSLSLSPRMLDTLYVALVGSSEAPRLVAPVIKQRVMTQSHIYLCRAAGSCHLACFRNQISFQSLV